MSDSLQRLHLRITKLVDLVDSKNQREFTKLTREINFFRSWCYGLQKRQERVEQQVIDMEARALLKEVAESEQ